VLEYHYASAVFLINLFVEILFVVIKAHVQHFTCVFIITNGNKPDENLTGDVS
jgi:hypothetical protein